MPLSICDKLGHYEVTLAVGTSTNIRLMINPSTPGT
jgi:hypothetical protein